MIIDHRGFRRLLHNGFRFGIHYQHALNGINWRCTTALKQSDENGKKNRCTARLKTKMINGYEMIKNDNIKHDH